MRKWIVAGAILISTVVVALALLLNINSLIERNKGYLLAQAEQALGRKISVGEVEATLFTGWIYDLLKPLAQVSRAAPSRSMPRATRGCCCRLR